MIEDFTDDRTSIDFYGLRVTRAVNGEMRRKYLHAHHFESAEAMWGEARKLDHQWWVEGEPYRRELAQAARPYQRGEQYRGQLQCQSPVAGVMFQVGPRKKGRFIHSPAFVATTSLPKPGGGTKTIRRSRGIKSYGPSRAWREVCELYAFWRGIDPEPLVARLPDPGAWVAEKEQELLPALETAET